MNVSVMRARRRLGTCALRIAAIGCAISACVGSGYEPVVAESETGVVQKELVERFYASRIRIRRMGYRLRARALPLCGRFRAPDAGLLLELPDEASRPRPSLLQARASFLPVLVEEPDASETGIRVLDVSPDSVLSRGGVRVDDLVRAIDGTPVRNIGHYNQLLLETRGRTARFGIERQGQTFEVEVRLPEVCSISIDFSEDPGLMTFSQSGPGGKRVAIPFGLLNAVDDDFLAIAMSHQMAHTLLDYARDPIPDPEATADRLGLLIAAQAGYDVRVAPDFWEWLAIEDPWRIASTGAFRFSRPHPWRPGARINYPSSELHLGIANRLPAIRASVAEILAAKQAP